MKGIRFKDLDFFLELKKGIQIIRIENPEYYRTLYFSFFNHIQYSENDVPMELEKYTLLINNPMELNLNEKKALSLLYKKCISNISDDNRRTIAEIEELSASLFDDLIYKSGLFIEYNPIVDLQKLFSTFSLQFKEVLQENYLEYLLNYISTNLELSRYKLILTFNLSNILTYEEYIQFSKEIEYQDIILLDIVSTKTFENTTFVVDKDLCVF